MQSKYNINVNVFSSLSLLFIRCNKKIKMKHTSGNLKNYNCLHKYGTLIAGNKIKPPYKPGDL